MAKERPSGSGGFPTRPGGRFGELEQVFDDVWWVWGTTRFMPGFLFPRNMWIVREGGELVVIHGVMLPEPEQKKVDALGPVKHIVRLGAFHGMDDARYVERYAPTVWAPAGVDSAVKIDRELRPGGELPLAGATLFEFAASRTPETALLLDRHGGVLFTCDSVQNWDTREGCSLLGGALARLMGFRGRACIGPGWRKMCEPRDGTGFGPDFRRLLELGFRHVLSGHGGPMRESARTDLRARVDALYGRA
jgi:hypothetical protein